MYTWLWIEVCVPHLHMTKTVHLPKSGPNRNGPDSESTSFLCPETGHVLKIPLQTGWSGFCNFCNLLHFYKQRTCCMFLVDDIYSIKNLLHFFAFWIKNIQLIQFVVEDHYGRTEYYKYYYVNQEHNGSTNNNYNLKKSPKKNLASLNKRNSLHISKIYSLTFFLLHFPLNHTESTNTT